MFKVKAVCISKNKGEKKKPVESVRLVKGLGIQDDAHAGSPRQVSLLAWESIQKMQQKGLKVGPGDFAENVVTEGIDLLTLSIGAKLKVGKDASLEITSLGKECHSRCVIYYQAGDCVMPREGIFARVLQGGEIKAGDVIEVIGA